MERIGSKDWDKAAGYPVPLLALCAGSAIEPEKLEDWAVYPDQVAAVTGDFEKLTATRPVDYRRATHGRFRPDEAIIERVAAVYGVPGFSGVRIVGERLEMVTPAGELLAWPPVRAELLVKLTVDELQDYAAVLGLVAAQKRKPELVKLVAGALGAALESSG